MTLAHQLLKLLPGLTNLVLHHLAGHATVRNAGIPDVLRPLADRKVLLRNDGELLLILPCKVRDVLHRHGQESEGSDGTKSKRGQSAEEDTAVA